MSSVGARLFLALASTAVAGLVTWRLLKPGDEPVGFTNQTGELERLLAGHDGSRSNVSGVGPFVLEEIDEETARALFVMHLTSLEYDPFSYYRYRPGVRQVIEWEEHPDGRWVRKTNAAGLRVDGDEGFEGADLRLLVAGDSHTDGVCNNAESFASLLEGRFAARNPGKKVRALNTGVAGFSFFNYLGALRKFTAGEDAPDVFVVAVYGGNDFIEVLRPFHYFNGTTLPPRRQGYWDRIEAAKKVSTSALAQGLNQVLYFQEFPDQIEPALIGARAVMGEIRRVCAERGVRLIVAYVPPAFEASWPELDVMCARAMDVLDITAADLQVARRLAQRFFADLAELEIETFDMSALFAEGVHYWKRDLHINLAGHARIAAEVDAELAAGGGRLAPLLESGRPDGPFEERDANGALLEAGEWSGGLRTGVWTQWYPGGKERSRGTWHEGRRTGEWSWWYEDGQRKKTGAYVDDVAAGEWREWYRSGQLRRVGGWSDGKPEGEWRQWHADGKDASRGAYRAGQQEGEWHTWFEDGTPESQVTYAGGILSGPGTRWHPTGALAWRGAYAAGRRTGPWVFHFRSGAKKSEGAFEDGARVGPWQTWDEDGALDPGGTGLFRAGERVGD